MDTIRREIQKVKDFIYDELHDSNVKAALISGFIFFILAFPDLFKAVDSLLRTIFGSNITNLHIVVLLIHSVIFSVLFYYVNRFVQKKLHDSL